MTLNIIDRIIEFIHRHDHFLLTTHMNADGDAYASTLAMAYYLTQLDKNFDIIIHDDQKEEKYDFFWGWDKIQFFSETIEPNFQAAIILDVPSKARIGNPAQLLPEPRHCIKIDHHPEEDHLAELNLVNTAASSTSQLVYDLLEHSAIEFTYPLAELLFSGIMYDTGRFSFSNTNHRDFKIAEHLTRLGVKPSEIANRIFFNTSFEAMKIIGYGLANMQMYLDGQVSLIFLPHPVLQQNPDTEIEELANYSVAIKGVEVGLFVREVKPNFFKVSLRSKGRVNVNWVAKAFDGGGHDHAAGCRIEGDFDEFRERILKEIQKQL